MLEDLYFGGAPTAVLEAATRPAELGPRMTRCCDAFAAGLRAAGADMHFGVQLPGALDAAGLQGVQAEFTSRLIRGGSAESLFYTNSVHERGSMLVSAGLLTQEDMDRTLAATVDPSTCWFSLGLVSAWGRRP